MYNKLRYILKLFQISSFTEKLAMVHCHYGKALKILLKQQDEKRSKDNEKKIIEVSSILLVYNNILIIC